MLHWFCICYFNKSFMWTSNIFNKTTAGNTSFYFTFLYLGSGSCQARPSRLNTKEERSWYKELKVTQLIQKTRAWLQAQVSLVLASLWSIGIFLTKIQGLNVVIQIVCWKHGTQNYSTECKVTCPCTCNKIKNIWLMLGNLTVYK